MSKNTNKSIENLYEFGGRPPKYKTVDELQKKIKDYFEECPDVKTIYFKLKDEVVTEEIPCLTITGLTLFLGFADRRSFYDYEKIKKFSHTIKRARTFIEKEYEMQIQQGNPAGAIFALKNFGWKDTQTLETDPEKPIEIKHKFPTPEEAKKYLENILLANRDKNAKRK